MAQKQQEHVAMNEREIFDAALALTDHGMQSAFLDKACGEDRAQRQRIEELLEAQRRLGSFLESPPPGLVGSPVISPPLPERPGTIIGPYKLLEQIGEGGMGVVFVAEQTQPVKRKVALKVIKPGMDSRQVIARFEAERQALAMMDHINIARVIDGGTTDTGRPYFVMELIHGIPITKYCDEKHLTPRERLELFIPVCQAIQHAHQKGIIHRDIKPSNVLVTMYDDKPVPKVIDFGVAKAIDQKLTDNTLCTNLGTMVGTLEYMSPEQADMNAQGIDTRSDIYSLGVLLYELLTGSTPLSRQQLKHAANLEILRMIKEEEPPKPSTRLSDSGEALASISAMRKTEPAKLPKLMRGELDWIVMKTLEKDRNRRYETPSGLARDVERFLADESVEACPPSVSYRFSKFAKRNRHALAMAGVIATALIVATGVSAWQAMKAREAQFEAEVAKKQAMTDAAIAQAVNDFLQHDLLQQVNQSPLIDDGVEKSSDLSVKEALDRAAVRIDQRFQDQPLVEAAIRTSIGEAYTSLWWIKMATTHLERAVALRLASLGSDHPDTLSSMVRLAGNYMMVGRAREAIGKLENVVENYRHLFGSTEPITLYSLDSLSSGYRIIGAWDKAIPLAKQDLEKRSAVLGPSHLDTVRAMHKLALIYLEAGSYVESLTWHEKTLAIWEATQDLDIGIVSMRTYARVLQEVGRLEEADYQLRKALELTQKRSDRRYREWGVAAVYRILGLNLLLQGRYAEAEPVAREALAIMEKETPDQWSRFHSMSLLGGALLGQQRYAEAEPFLVQGYEGMKQRETFMDAGLNHWLTKAGERLISFYEATNQPEKIRIWREKLSAMK